MDREIKPRYIIKDGQIFDKGFDVALNTEIVCDLLNKLHEKHGAPIYECIDDEEDYEWG